MTSVSKGNALVTHQAKSSAHQDEPFVDHYVEQYTAQYSSVDEFEPKQVEIRRQHVLQSLCRHQPKRILEAGCGLEPLFLFYTDFDRFSVIEPSAEFCKHAQRLAAAEFNDHGERITISHGYAEQSHTQLAAQEYDFIVVSSLLHEVADPHALLQSIYRLCGQHTVVHLNVPNARSFHRLLAVELGLIQDVYQESAMERRFRRQTKFDQKSLHEVTSAAGFSVIRSESYFIKPFTHRQMARLVQMDDFPPNLLDGLQNMAKYMPGLGSEISVELTVSKP